MRRGRESFTDLLACLVLIWVLESASDGLMGSVSLSNTERHPSLPKKIWPVFRWSWLLRQLGGNTAVLFSQHLSLLPQYSVLQPGDRTASEASTGKVYCISSTASV